MGRFANLANYTAEENLVWEQVCAGAGKTFRTLRGLEFTYTIRGNELFVDRKAKSLTRATVVQTYRRACEVLREGKPITGPKTLGNFGASYLLPVFRQLALLEEVADDTGEP